MNLKFFTNISKVIGPAFLLGMDKIFCHLLVVNLQAFLAMFQRSSTSDAKYKKILDEFKDSSPNVFSTDSKNYYANINKFNDNVASLRCILNVGQLQILRKEIAFQLNKNSRFYARNHELALRVLNELSRVIFMFCTSLILNLQGNFVGNKRTFSKCIETASEC